MVAIHNSRAAVTSLPAWLVFVLEGSEKKVTQLLNDPQCLDGSRHLHETESW